MRLSEAIRLGAMMKPQGFEGTGTRWHPETCAFGAALEAVSADRLEDTDWWLWLPHVQTKCPACDLQWSYGLIPHLNNEHRWTREQIADWVETIEPQIERRADADQGTPEQHLTTAASDVAQKEASVLARTSQE